MVPLQLALLPPGPTHVAIRWAHLLGMAALFGGAVLCWGLLRRDAIHETPAATLSVSAAYEWLFWAGAGLLVLTGVGNLGAMAPAIPGPSTPWGTTFSIKLLGVLGLLLGSLVRTLGVVGLVVGSPTRLAPVAFARLRVGYAATAVYLLGVVLLAEVLAHG